MRLSLDVIYFKDENGKKTKEPAVLYVGASDYNVGLKQLQKAIDQWEKDDPNFLRKAVDNGWRVFFQNKANGQPGAMAKYGGEGIIFYNCGKIDKKMAGSGDFVKTIRNYLGVEPFGIRGDALWGISFTYNKSVVATIKQELAVKCSQYLYLKTDNKYYADVVEYYRKLDETYRAQANCDSIIDNLIVWIKENNVYLPYGADSWAEIDNANLKGHID